MNFRRAAAATVFALGCGSSGVPQDGTAAPTAAASDAGAHRDAAADGSIPWTPLPPAMRPDAGSAPDAQDMPDAQDVPDAMMSTPDAAPSCISPGADCRGNANGCCNGSSCVFDIANPAHAVCAANCLGNASCSSGCCTVLVSGTAAVCAPVEYCSSTCQAPGNDCGSGETCCPNSVCITSTVTGITCAARCANNLDCISGCCAPLTNTGDLVCSPQTFCH